MSKAKIKTYLFHEISSYLPLLEGEEFDALVDDIKQFGQIEPAILFEGKIIDGRNRYRACKQLGIALKTREWKPSEMTGLTPLQFVISENIMRRHLTIAQRSEIGLLLLEEEEKLAKERRKEITKLQRPKGSTKYEKITKLKDTEKLKNGTSVEKVAPKVKIGSATLSKAKKIKEIAKEDKKIAEDWEKAKKGDIGVDAVYKEVKKKEFIEKLEKTEPEVKKAIEEKRITPKEAKEIITLPKELKQAVIKPKAKITVKEAKEVAELPKDIIKEVTKEEISIDDAKAIAEIPKPEFRKEAVKVIKKQKKQQELTKDYIMDVAKGNEPMPKKYVDVDKKMLQQLYDLKKQIMIKMRRGLIDSYSETTRQECYKIAKEIVNYLITEFSDKVNVINV